MDLNKLFDLEGTENPILGVRQQLPEVLDTVLRQQGDTHFQITISPDLARILIKDLRFAIEQYPKGIPDSFD